MTVPLYNNQILKMGIVMEQLMGWWQTFILSMGRVGAMVALAPVLGGRTMPMLIKVLVTLLLTIFCLTAVGIPAAPLSLAPEWFALLILKEMLIGFLIGFTITVVIAACQGVGVYMGFQMMFTAAATFMAYSQEKSTVISNYFYIFAVLIFVSIDGHHWLIRALLKSFELIPVFTIPGHFGSMQSWIKFFGQLFEVGLHLALPLMATLLITNLMLGMIARTMPQLNVFVVGLPIQIMVGILIMILMINGLTIAETGIFKEWTKELMLLIRAMAT